MKAIATIGAVAIALALAVPAGATGGQQSFRILAQGDFGAVALSSFCANTYPEPAGIGANGLPFVSTCYFVKTQLGYDGTTGAAWDTTDHLNHAFSCGVTSSATGLDSITVGFDLDGNTIIDNSYPNSRWFLFEQLGLQPVPLPPNPTGNSDVDNQIPDSLNPNLRDGFIITGVLRGSFWPSVSGNVDGNFAVIFDHLGFDQTVDCAF